MLQDEVLKLGSKMNNCMCFVLKYLFKNKLQSFQKYYDKRIFLILNKTYFDSKFCLVTCRLYVRIIKSKI